MAKGMKVSALVKIFAWMIFGYLAYCGLLFVMQRQVMFPRGLIEVPAEDPHIPGLERIWINYQFRKG